MSSNGNQATKNNVTYTAIANVKNRLNKNQELKTSNEGKAFMTALSNAGVLANGKNNLDNGSQSRYNDLKINAKKPISKATRNLNKAINKSSNRRNNPNGGAPPGSQSVKTINGNNKKQNNDTKEISVEEWFRGLNGYGNSLIAKSAFPMSVTAKSLPLKLRGKFFIPSANGKSKFKNTNNTKGDYPRIAELYACVFLALPGYTGTYYVFTLEEHERRKFLTTKEFGEWFDREIEPKIKNGNRNAANTYMKGLIDHVMNTYDIQKSMQMDYTNSLTRARAERGRLKNMKGFANKNVK